MKIFILLAAICFFSTNGFAAVKTWDGGGVNNNWTTAANWVGDVAPVAGDDLVFPAAAAKFTASNDFFFNTTFNSLKIDGGDYTIGGSPFRLVGGLTVNAGSQSINTAISLNAAQSFTATKDTDVHIAAVRLGGFSLNLTTEGFFAIGVISDAGALTKGGLGLLYIFSASDFTGSVTQAGGILIVDANIPNSRVTVSGSGVGATIEAVSGLFGTGTIGATEVISGAIGAGTLTSPTGILTVQGNLTVGSNGFVVAKLAGTTAGSGYDQLRVNGAVTLDKATLVPVAFNDFLPVVGDSFVIISNDGTDSVVGNFAGIAEGGTFVAPLGLAFRVTYRGGDGNDVAITRVNRARFDFDGDGKSDISVFRPSNGFWYQLLSRNNNFASQQFGASEDKIVPADYDGDARTDIAVFRPSNGVWYYLRSSDNTYSAVQFGTNGDIPVPNDFDGDGRDDFAVFRPSNGTWYQQRSLGNQFFTQQFGTSGDRPQVGDFNGDGIGDLAVYRDCTWFLSESPNATFRAVQFGLASDTPTPADFDGDGATDISVFRPSNGVWYRLNSGGGNSFAAIQFGLAEDKPAAADYDGDGKSDVAVFRPSNGVWYLLRSTSGFGAVGFGQNGDRPIPNAFVP